MTNFLTFKNSANYGVFTNLAKIAFTNEFNIKLTIFSKVTKINSVRNT